jgi:hypothetical protein
MPDIDKFLPFASSSRRLPNILVHLSWEIGSWGKKPYELPKWLDEEIFVSLAVGHKCIHSLDIGSVKE